MIKVGLVSLGCPKNLVDSEIMLGFLSREPYRITSRLEQAQVVIVNTCAFLEEARRESQETLGRLAALKDRNCRLLIAAGCLVQYWGRSAPRRIPAADLLLGVGEYHTLPELVSRALGCSGKGGRNSNSTGRAPGCFPLPLITRM
jgi:ribosomal protein S12 methylthiotransferase